MTNNTDICNIHFCSELDIAMSARTDPKTGKTVYSDGRCKLPAGHTGYHDARG